MLDQRSHINHFFFVSIEISVTNSGKKICSQPDGGEGEAAAKRSRAKK